MTYFQSLSADIKISNIEKYKYFLEGTFMTPMIKRVGENGLRTFALED